jgi:hypothetical protein
MMKRTKPIGVAICFVAAILLFRLGADERSSAAFEYVTIRWSGKENTHLIRPVGKVEFIGGQLRAIQKPERADDRSFYMNVAMNGLAQEGYEFSGMTSDEIVMRRAVKR